MKKNLCIVLCLILALTGCTSAFAEAGRLILPAGTKVIGDEAFMGSAAVDVVIPEGATSIGSRAFADCEDLNSVTIPSSVTSIAGDAFSGSDGFEVIAEEGSYADSWWKEYSGETEAAPIDDFDYIIENGEVTITGYNRYIGDIATLVIPSTIEEYPVTAIGDDAFYTESEDISIGTIIIPEGVKTIGNSAFSCCSAASISLPSTLLSIGYYAFDSCDSLTEIDLPEGLVSIGSYAFAYCRSLEKLVIPASVTELGSNIAVYSRSIDAFEVAEGNPNYAVLDGVLFTKDMKTLIAYPYAKQGNSYAVPQGVTAIAACAFDSCDRLTSVILPDSVISIGPNAFYWCDSLRTITIPESVTAIDESAFYECYVLTIHGVSGSYAESYAGEMDIPFSAEDAPETGATPADEFDYTIENGEVTITYYNGYSSTVIIPETIEGYPVTAIEGLWCNYTIYHLRIPASVTYFDTDECEFGTLHTLEVDPANPVYVTVDNALYTKDMKTLIAYPGNTSASSLTVPEGVTRIADYAFDDCNLNTIYLPDSLTEIGEGAFSENYSLQEITVPGGVTLGASVFYDCYRLTRAVIGEGVTEILEYAFECCYSLREVVLPDSLVSIGENAFYNCDSLTEIRLPAGLTEINENAFGGCGSLSSITVDEANSVYASLGGALYTKDMKTLIAYPMGKEDASYTVPEGVTAIADDAFHWNDYLAEVSLPSTLVSIGEYAFASCYMLTEIDIPDSVTEIGAHAFDNSGLREIRLSAALTEIGEGVFESCEMATLTIPGTIRTIGAYAFSDCNNLLSVSIEEGVETIDTEAFSSCQTLGYVYIPDSVTSIAYDAFDSSNAVTLYGVGGSYAESYASDNGIPFVAELLPENPTTPVDLFEYTIEDGEVTITSFDAYNCDVTIPASIEGYPVTVIAEDAFCDSLQDIFIPASVTLIERSAFYGHAESFTVDPANTAYASVDGVLFTKDMTTLVRYPAYDDVRVSYDVPEGVTRIDDYAFYESTYLEAVTLPDTLVSIGYSAFEDCYRTESINLPASLTEIDDYAFSFCESLKAVVIPEGVTELGVGTFACCFELVSISLPSGLTSIGVGCFEDCSLRSIVLPEGLLSIGDGAFSGNRLTTVTLPASLVELSASAFSSCGALTSISVADGNSVFASADGVLFSKDMKTLVLYPNCKADAAYTVPESVQVIGPNAFRYSEPKEIILPEGVTSIGEYAFYNCYNLETIRLPETLTVIGEGVFKYCESLTEIVIPDSVTSLEDYAFQGCYSLTDVTLGSGLTTIGDYAFEECYELTEIVIPDSVTSLGYSAFAWCYDLTDITIGSGLTAIPNYAFAWCDSLESVRIPETVTSIGTSAFYECPSDLTICGVPGSYAETFAASKGYTFEAYTAE